MLVLTYKLMIATIYPLALFIRALKLSKEGHGFFIAEIFTNINVIL